MEILFLEPFYGGSHKDFADGIIEHSDHDFHLVTLSAHHWKWRMRGAALSFYGTIEEPQSYDLLFVTDLMGVADLKALWNNRCPPIVLYFHENQLSYPVPPGERMDYHFGFTNITSALAADIVLFNSEFHLRSFFEALPGFISKMPKKRPTWVIDEIRRKSTVRYPGCRFSSHNPPPKRLQGTRPLIVWNHRWEFDKDPDTFFHALAAVDDMGFEFDLALLGENFQVMPKVFIEAKDRYKDRVLVFGYVESRREYLNWLTRGDIVISTANQENFGISIVEAVRHGCFPLLPDRLAYPEVVPDEFHSTCLYRDSEDLVDRLATLLRSFPAKENVELQSSMSEYAWDTQIWGYDNLFSEIISGGMPV